MAINEEQAKIRERLVGLETKLSFIHGLLQEIRDELKEHPTRDEYEALSIELQEIRAEQKDLRNNQTTATIKVGILSGILGMVGGIIIKLLMG